jgi:hypothetical protein
MVVGPDEPPIVPTDTAPTEGHIPPGTPPPKVTVEVWDGEDQVEATVADVVRINDTWHVVVTIDA